MEKVGVVGAGLMGAEIGLVFALAGHEVLLSDTGEAQLKAAMDRLARAMDRGIQRGDYRDEEKPLALARIATSVSLDPFADCDFVTEAVFEDEAIKAETWKNSTRSASPPASSPPTPRRSRSRPSPRMSARRAGRTSSARIISRRSRG